VTCSASREAPQNLDLHRALLQRHGELLKELERLELAEATSEVTRELKRVRQQLRRIEKELEIPVPPPGAESLRGEKQRTP